MNLVANNPAAASSRTTLLAVGSIAVWALAASGAGPFGVWPWIGGTAVGLGLAALLLDRAASRAALRPSPVLVALGAVAGGVMSAATYLLYPLLTRLVPFLATDTARLYSAFRAPPLAVVSLALAPVVFGEELVWRNVVQSALVRRLGRPGGVTVAAIAYALAHAPLGSPVLMLVALLCGLTWGALRAASGSLVPTLVAHLVWDVLVLLWLPLDSR